MIELFYGKFSGNSSRAVFGLNEIGAPFQPVLVDIKGGENKGAPYLGVNPMGKIPAMRDGAFTLWESNAINWYAAEKAQSALIPGSIEGRASVHRWLFFQAQHVTPACVQIFRATNERVRKFWGFTDAAAPESALKELKRWLEVLEQALQGREYLEGAFTLADVAYAPHLILVGEGGYPYPPNVAAWVKRLEARPAWQKTAKLVFSE